MLVLLSLLVSLIADESVFLARSLAKRYCHL